MKKNYNSRQEKIYSDYSDHSTEKLVEAVKTKKYVESVLEIIQDILEERGIDINNYKPKFKASKKEVANKFLYAIALGITIIAIANLAFAVIDSIINLDFIIKHIMVGATYGLVFTQKIFKSETNKITIKWIFLVFILTIAIALLLTIISRIYFVFDYVLSILLSWLLLSLDRGEIIKPYYSIGSTAFIVSNSKKDIQIDFPSFCPVCMKNTDLSSTVEFYNFQGLFSKKKGNSDNYSVTVPICNDHRLSDKAQRILKLISILPLIVIVTFIVTDLLSSFKYLNDLLDKSYFWVLLFVLVPLFVLGFQIYLVHFYKELRYYPFYKPYSIIGGVKHYGRAPGVAIQIEKDRMIRYKFLNNEFLKKM